MRPGVNVIEQQPSQVSGVPSSTGTTFVGGLALTGPAAKAVLVRNLGDFVNIFGPRQSWNALTYDGLDGHWQEGGGPVQFCRVVGPAATSDTFTLQDSTPAASLTVTAKGPGVSGLSVAVVAGVAGGTYQLVVTNTAGQVVDQSYDLTTVTDAVTWATSAVTVNVTAAGATPPAVHAAQALTGGADDRTSITDTVRLNALTAAFPKTLGPGQLVYPGGTTDALREGLENLATATNRHACVSFADTAVAATLEASAQTLRVGVPDASFASTYAGWLTIPGIIRGTTRTISPDIIAAALMSRSDQASGNPNLIAGGDNGICRYVLGPTQTFSDTDLQALSLAGVNCFVQLGPAGGDTATRLYGGRTVVDPNGGQSAWLSVGASRLRMAVQADAYAIGQHFVFAQLDGRSSSIQHFNGDLVAALTDYWRKGALYGDTAADAFSVDTGADINTPATLQADELNARIAMRTSPFAEMVTFYLTPVPITQAVS